MALGRSCGGFLTKIHGVCDGNPIGFILTAGQISDHCQGKDLIEGFECGSLLSDKGYDSLLEFATDKNASSEGFIRNAAKIKPNDPTGI